MPQPTAEITADASLSQAKKNAPYFKKLLTGTRMHMHSGMGSVREADHNGHHIVVQTIYKVTIDGKPFKGALGVTNGGMVHNHGMPNVGFASAVDLVKAVIDTFPDEFAKSSSGGHEGHDGTTTMPMGGMKMKTKKRPAAKRAKR